MKKTKSLHNSTMGMNEAVLFKANTNINNNKTQEVLTLLLGSITEMQQNDSVKLLYQFPGTGLTEQKWNCHFAKGAMHNLPTKSETKLKEYK